MKIVKKAVSCFLILLLCYSSCAISTAQALLSSTQDEIDSGAKFAKQIEAEVGLSEDEELQARVARIAAKLAKGSERKLPYTVKVLKDKSVNAFALPGGYIFLLEGLTDYLRTDEELAGIIGHEMGHAMCSHSSKQMEKSLGMTLVSIALFGGAGVFLQLTAIQAIMSGYSRADEREADRIGFELSSKAGYSPYSMLVSMERMRDYSAERLAFIKENNEGTKLKEGEFDWFDSHPTNTERIVVQEKYIQSLNIPFKVIVDDLGFAKVRCGEWELPSLENKSDAYKPLYRAQLLAGTLYVLSKMKDYNVDNYMPDKDGEDIIIYYKDREIIRITPLDAEMLHTSAEELSDDFLSKLRTMPRV